MKLIPICSSSKGNCTYIGTLNSGIVIDIGCGFKSLAAVLSSAGADVNSINAILITHKHTDHIKGLFTLTKQKNIPVFGAEETLDYLIKHGQISPNAELHTLDELDKVFFDAQISAFRTPHDTHSVGYRFDFSETALGFCTDLGHISETVRKNLTGCRTVFIESNYQPELLQNNSLYPEYLKRRISGDEGHLSNSDCAEFCAELIKGQTVNLILGHLSPENNTSEIAFNTVKNRLSMIGGIYERDYTLRVARRTNEGGEYIAV